MLSLPLRLHIICIQSPYDMYPSMIVRENSHSHVKRARSQQQLIQIHISCFGRSLPQLQQDHPRYTCTVCILPIDASTREYAYCSQFCICLKFCLHGISLNTRVYKESTRSKVFIYICDMSVSSWLMILTLLRASISICSHDMRIYSLWVHWCITRRLQPRQHTYIHHIKWHWYVLCSVKAFVCTCDE